jgi:ectoine hydroxylase-related dioxygenase (phytanoyl-CoA dioxygenase family)
LRPGLTQNGRLAQNLVFNVSFGSSPMHGPLVKSQRDEFSTNGYLHCPELLAGPSLTHVRNMVEEVANWPEGDRRCQHYHELTENGRVLARTERFLSHHPGLRELFTDGIVSAVVSQLFGESALVFKEKINYKLPGGGGFAPHQDAQAYAYGTSHITCLLAVDENTIDNGCLWFAPGQHGSGLLETDDAGCLTERIAGSMEWLSAPLSAGGATFFSSFVPHKSRPNLSSESRRSLYVTYTRASEGDLRSEYYSERDRAMSQHETQLGDAPRISTIGHFQGKGVE